MSHGCGAWVGNNANVRAFYEFLKALALTLRGFRHLISHRVAGRDVTFLSLSLSKGTGIPATCHLCVWLLLIGISLSDLYLH